MKEKDNINKSKKFYIKYNECEKSMKINNKIFIGEII